MFDRLIKKLALARDVLTLFNNKSDYAKLLHLYRLEIAENRELKERLGYAQSLLTAAAGIEGVSVKTDSLMNSLKSRLN